jgi:signal transduction histidine kinase
MTTLDQAQKKNDTKARRPRALSRSLGGKRMLGIQWRLLGYLSLFVAVALLVIWIFQIRMLAPFYEDIKNREMKQTADSLCELLRKKDTFEAEDDITLKNAVWTYAGDYNICVRVWRVVEEHARIAASAEVSEDCIIHHITGDRIADLYQQAAGRGGGYSCKVSFYDDGMVWMDNDGNLHFTGEVTEDSAEDIREDLTPPYDNNVSALYVRLVKGADGMEYVIMLDSELRPLSATVSTLRAQFYWIAAILLVTAFVLALIMSNRISRPLVRMNKQARTLAKGHYDVHFNGHGYRETRELAETLNYAAAELSKIDGLQKELIANVSHDLRTPLTMIKGYGEVMRDLPDENTPENVQVIIDEATHLSELVNDLLDLSRLQAGMRMPEKEVFDLTESVRAVLHRYDKLTSYDGYHIVFDADCNVPVYADRTMILQVVYNLVNNAISYCGEDKVIEVTQTLREDGTVCLSVRDHGVGIDPEQLPYIWDRYYKLDRVHRRAMIGTGLGLSIVKGVLEMHGGQYGVNSTPGCGSEFWFCLSTSPMADEEDEQEEC